MFPVALRRERAAAEAADRRVEHGRARLERCERVRVAGVPRVVEVAADGDAELCRRVATSARTCARRRRLRSCRRGRSRRARPRRRARRARARGSRSTSPSNGQPNATLSVTVDADAVLPRALDDAPCRGERLLDRRVLVPLVERLRHAEREAHLVEPGRDEPLVAALVEREPGEDDVRRPARAPRRPPPRPPSAARVAGRRSSRPRSTGSPARASRRTSSARTRRSEDLRLVLEPVARPDVVDGHTAGAHAGAMRARPSGRRGLDPGP